MRRFQRFTAGLIWVVLYGTAVYFGLSFYFEPEQVATFWPASGLFLGILIVRPHREWPWIALLCVVGQLLADQVSTQRPLHINALFALSNTLEPVIGAALVLRVYGRIPRFNRLRDVLGTTLIGVVLAPILTATIGAAVVSNYYGANYLTSLQIWWAADALGILAVAPLVIHGGTLASWTFPNWTRPRFETALVVAVTVLVSLFVFFRPPGPALSVLDHPYVVFPLLIWAALRLSPRAVAAVSFAICCMVVVATDNGTGPFMQFGESTRERVLAVQAFLAVSTLSASILCAVVRERMDAERRRIAVEDRLRQTQKMEAVGQLAGGVAHDFNNLLMVIQSSLTLVEDDLKKTPEVDESTLEFIRQADEATDRAAGLTRQLLLFSRRHPLQRETLDLDEVLESLSPMLRRVIGEHVRMEARTTGTLPGIHADRGQIEQVLMNLIINARDAMPNGGLVEIETTVLPAESGEGSIPNPRRVQLTIADTGTGIAPEALPRIFDPFFTTKGLGSGTGLGLATVHGIVTGNDGDIRVHSTPGRGTKFTLSFPVVETETSRPEPVQPGPERGGETILICEDEAALRPILRSGLERGGYRVLVAADSDEALQLAPKGVKIDLLVTDIVMPGLNGRQLAERLTVIHPGLRVLFISGYPSHEFIGEAGQFEPYALLQKPFRASDLRGRVREVLDRVPPHPGESE